MHLFFVLTTSALFLGAAGWCGCCDGVDAATAWMLRRRVGCDGVEAATTPSPSAVLLLSRTGGGGRPGGVVMLSLCNGAGHVAALVALLCGAGAPGPRVDHAQRSDGFP